MYVRGANKELNKALQRRSADSVTQCDGENVKHDYSQVA